MVVFPFEPVIQIILASVYLPANSISEMIGVPCSLNFRISGASLGIPGLFTTSSALKICSSVCRPSSQAMPWPSRRVLYLSLIADISDTKVSNPFTLARTAAPAPLSPAPNTTILFMIFRFRFINRNLSIRR